MKKWWSEWWQIYRHINDIFSIIFFQFFPPKNFQYFSLKKDEVNANGDRYIDISMISFTYGGNCNRSKLFILSNYWHINNINLSIVLTYPHYQTFHNVVFFDGAIDPWSCLKIGVKSTIFELQKSLKYKSSSLINFQINRTN